MKKMVLWAVGFACLAGPFSALAQKPAINVGYIGTAELMPLIAAKEKGIFDKHGLDVTITRIQLASNVPSAIVAGNLQIGMGTGPMLLQTADAGLGFVAIAAIAHMTRQDPPASLVARSGFKVSSAADLKGHRIGVPGFNSMFHVIFQKWLLDHGVQPKEVSMIEAVFPQMGDQLKGGTLDAVLVIEPFRSRIIGSGVATKVSDFVAEVNPDIVSAYWMAKADWVASNAATVRAFREAYAEGIDWCLKNRNETQAMEVKILGAPAPSVPTYRAQISAADFEPYARMGQELHLFRQAIDVNKLVVK